MRFIAMGFCVAGMLGLASPARADWYEAKSKHFVIYGEAKSADELGDYARKLERFDQAVRTARGMQDPPLTDANRLTIYVLKSPQEFARLRGDSWEGLMGIYMPSALGTRAFVAKNEAKLIDEMDSDTVFFHEYAHHLMLQSSSAALPTWLVEGFAEFLSTAKINADGTVTLGRPALHRAIAVNSTHHDLPLTMMLRETYDFLGGWADELRYGRGWLLTHYLTFEPTRRGQLDRYVANIQRGVSPIDSAVTVFGDLKKLDWELDQYADRKQLNVIVVRPDEAKVGGVDVRALSAAEVALLPTWMRLEFGVAKQRVAGIAAQARKLAEPYQNDPFAQATLAEAEYAAKHYDAANAAASRALATDPRYLRALIYKGEAETKIAKAQGSGADWSYVRSAFLQANKVDTEYAAPLYLFYESFDEAGQKPSKNAVDGLLYAVALAPQDRGLRIEAVRELLIEERVSEAKAMLAPIAFLPHGDKETREALAKIMAAISANDAKAALAILEEQRAKAKKEQDS
jgi:hypothetical protein